MPDLPRIRALLQRPKLFTVVQDVFMTEIARLADVVVPAAIWAERTGTFTNFDRTVHISRKAVDPPGQARSDLDIFLDPARNCLAARASPDPATRHIRAAPPGSTRTTCFPRPRTPASRSATTCRPMPPSRRRITTPLIRGAGAFLKAAHYQLAPEMSDADYPFILTTRRVLT